MLHLVLNSCPSEEDTRKHKEFNFFALFSLLLLGGQVKRASNHSLVQVVSLQHGHIPSSECVCVWCGNMWGSCKSHPLLANMFLSLWSWLGPSCAPTDTHVPQKPELGLVASMPGNPFPSFYPNPHPASVGDDKCSSRGETSGLVNDDLTLCRLLSQVVIHSLRSFGWKYGKLISSRRV